MKARLYKQGNEWLLDSIWPASGYRRIVPYKHWSSAVIVFNQLLTLWARKLNVNL